MSELNTGFCHVVIAALPLDVAKYIQHTHTTKFGVTDNTKSQTHLRKQMFSSVLVFARA